MARKPTQNAKKHQWPMMIFGHPVEKQQFISFVGLVCVALASGFLAAKFLFGGVAPAPESPVVIQQSMDLPQNMAPKPMAEPEPNSNPSPARVAEILPYEEHSAEETYEPIITPPNVSPNVSAPNQPLKTALWKRNAIEFTAIKNQPMVSIIIDDMGVDRGRSKRMWEDVPGPLTLSFLTYANALPEQTKAASGRGHELMLHMSMEPSNPDIDAGPNVLLGGMGDDELRRLVNWGLNRFEGYVAVNNHMGSRFTENERAMTVVLETIKAHDVLFLDSRTSPKSAGPQVAKALGMQVLQRHVFLDNENRVEKVMAQLNSLERIARQHGKAIAIGHPKDATIEALKTWIPAARARGITVAPISAFTLP